VDRGWTSGTWKTESLKENKRKEKSRDWVQIIAFLSYDKMFTSQFCKYYTYSMIKKRTCIPEGGKKKKSLQYYCQNLYSIIVRYHTVKKKY